jgi:hypothetical protein
MLYTKTDSTLYIREFKERFTSFAQKAPILLSFVVSDKSVQVIHENSQKSYDFEWDFTIPVKSFIHQIKLVISSHYPRIAQTVREEIALTVEEQAALLSEATVTADNLPTHKVVESSSKVYKIDKVIALKDTFILVDEATGQMSRYKMEASSIFFLRNYRNGKYGSLAEAGDYFFSHSTLLNELSAAN